MVGSNIDRVTLVAGLLCFRIGILVILASCAAVLLVAVIECVVAFVKHSASASDLTASRRVWSHVHPFTIGAEVLALTGGCILLTLSTSMAIRFTVLLIVVTIVGLLCLAHHAWSED